MRLAIYQCPIHKDFYAVALDSDDGTGLRLTPSKCCGQWRVVRSWQITPTMASEMIQGATDAISQRAQVSA